MDQEQVVAAAHRGGGGRSVAHAEAGERPIDGASQLADQDFAVQAVGLQLAR
jgi:hypothetical protein